MLGRERKEIVPLTVVKSVPKKIQSQIDKDISPVKKNTLDVESATDAINMEMNYLSGRS